MTKEFLEKEVQKYVEEEEGEVKVDWEGIKNKKSSGEYSPEFEDILSRHLLDLGVLSQRKKGNYGVFGCGICLDPVLYIGPGMRLYFTEREEAERYEEGMYSDTLYETGIREL